jgi:hypothetical protein
MGDMVSAWKGLGGAVNRIAGVLERAEERENAREAEDRKRFGREVVDWAATSKEVSWSRRKESERPEDLGKSADKPLFLPDDEEIERDDNIEESINNTLN